MGAIRIKDHFTDLILINAYLDPKANIGDEIAIQTNEQVLSWIMELCDDRS